MFHFSKEWKERGIGTFKVNVRTGANGKKTGRMIMRADGAGRVMLNSPIFEGMRYGNAQNEAPDSKQILLASTEGGHTIPLLLRVSVPFSSMICLVLTFLYRQAMRPTQRTPTRRSGVCWRGTRILRESPRQG